MHVAYAKYLAILNTLDKLSKLATTGTRTHTNTKDDVVEIFVGKFSYFKNHASVFPLLVHSPAMKEWLEETAEPVGDVADIAAAYAVVWGSEKHSFDSLRKILTAHEKAAAVKGKGKGKEVNRVGSPSPPIPVERRTANKKDKRKEVLANKKASSSKGHHGYD
jgi:hypothetical protein